jgi:hypothetical protein
VISEADALARAEQAVRDADVDPGDRRRSVAARGDDYEVVFYAPPDMLAGDFTVLVDRASGAITSERYER